MSRDDLALAMDMPVDRLEEIEAGRAGFTSLDLRRAADALDVSLGDFFREPLQIDGQRFPDPSQREMVRFAASLHRDLDLVERFGSSSLG